MFLTIFLVAPSRVALATGFILEWAYRSRFRR